MTQLLNPISFEYGCGIMLMYLFVRKIDRPVPDHMQPSRLPADSKEIPARLRVSCVFEGEKASWTLYPGSLEAIQLESRQSFDSIHTQVFHTS